MPIGWNLKERSHEADGNGPLQCEDLVINYITLKFILFSFLFFSVAKGTLNTTLYVLLIVHC